MLYFFPVWPKFLANYKNTCSLHKKQVKKKQTFYILVPVSYKMEYYFENHGFLKFLFPLRTSVPGTFYFRFVFCLLSVIRPKNGSKVTKECEGLFVLYKMK